MLGNFYNLFFESLVFFKWSLPASLFFTLLLEFLYAFFIGKIRGWRGLGAVICCSLITWPLAIIFYQWITGIYYGAAAIFWVFILTEVLVILAEWRLLCLVINDSKRMFKLSLGMNAFSALFFPLIAMVYIILAY